MSLTQSVVFVKALHCTATQMGWNQGATQITTFTNAAGKSVNIIKALKMQCERFCKVGEADSETHTCLAKSLTTSTQAKLLTH